MQLDLELEEFVSKLESDWAEHGSSDFTKFLPSTDNEQFDAVAMELMRVDAELATRAGHQRNLNYYTELLPNVLSSEHHRQQLAFELSRLSSASNQSIAYPQVGEVAAGFELLSLLGQGAFSQVYLAAENELSRRLVILKFSTKFPGEAATLARLQHKNIVPIYSWHRHNQFHIVCMPYLGATTLWDFLKSHLVAHRRTSAVNSPALGQAIVSTVCNRRSQTLADISRSMNQSQLLGNSGSVNQSTNQSDDKPTSHSRTSSHQPHTEKFNCVLAGSAELFSEHPEAGLSAEVPKLLSRQNSAETVLWIGKELAEGLMHAHERGVLHRDIKPANILLADDGTPMLLDFNLAVSERKNGSDTPDVGGTPRYMAPEQLESLNIPGTTVGPHADLYSLGVVLFELAVGRSPFDEPKENWESAIPGMLEQRRKWSPTQVKWPKSFSPAGIEIITQLLSFDPVKRYPSARALYEDLELQLQNRPLKHARNRSMLELTRKWALRHPRLSSSAVVGSVLGAVILLALSMVVWRQRQVAALRAQQWLVKLEKAQLPAQASIAQAVLPTEQVRSMIAASEDLIAEPNTWQAQTKLLDTQDREKANQLLGQLLWYRACGKCELGIHETDQNQRKSYLDAALKDTEFASRLMAIGMTANAQLAEQIRVALEGKPIAPVSQLVPEEIIEETKRLIGRDATNPWYWWSLGHRQFVSGDIEGALASAQVANQMDEKFPWSHYLMAQIHIDTQQFALAESELNTIVNMKQIDSPELYINRAIARLAQGKPVEARQDLDLIIDHVPQYPRIYFLREQASRMLGDNAAADSDLAAALKCEPTDAHGFAARADARLRLSPPDAEGALSDFTRATEMQRERASFYENRAFVLSELMHRRAEAVEVLSQAIARFPKQARFYSSRATLWGRQKNIEAARKDVDVALQLDRSPIICYQAASALLLASDQAEDRARAIALLKETLRKEPALKGTMDTDPDLEPIRDDEQFKSLLNAALLLQ